MKYGEWFPPPYPVAVQFLEFLQKRCPAIEWRDGKNSLSVDRRREFPLYFVQRWERQGTFPQDILGVLGSERKRILRKPFFPCYEPYKRKKRKKWIYFILNILEERFYSNYVRRPQDGVINVNLGTKIIVDRTAKQFSKLVKMDYDNYIALQKLYNENLRCKQYYPDYANSY